MTKNHSTLPRFTSFAGLQCAADAAGLAFVGPAEIDDPVRNSFAMDWRSLAMIAGLAVAASALLAWMLI